MPWFYVDDAFADSKPVMLLHERLRNEAIGLWVRCGAWSAKEETDGHVPLDVVRQFGGNKRLVLALANDSELWHPLPDDKNWAKTREILFKNWEKWQKTRADNERRRKQEAARSKHYRNAKRGRKFVLLDGGNSDDTETSRRDDTYAEEADSKKTSRKTPSAPDPTQTLSKDLGVCSHPGKQTSSHDTHHDRPTEFCDDHPHGTKRNCGPCGNARRAAQAWDDRRQTEANLEAVIRAAERQTELEIAARCPDCKGTHWVIDEDPDAPARKCTHPTLTGATP